MSTEFDRIKNLAGWRNKLDELLEAARDAAKKDDLEERLTIADRLTQFIVKNPRSTEDDPASVEYDDMDKVALAAHDGLLLGGIQERVAAIMGRTVELAALRKTIEGRVATNQKAAASIRLEKARRVIDSTTNAVTAMMDLKKEIERAAEAGAADADLASVGKQIEKLIATFQTLRNDLETIV